MRVVFLLLIAFLCLHSNGATIYRIGVLDNKANSTATFLQWAPTFDTYLNRYLGVFGATFRVEMVSLTFDELAYAASAHQIDFLYSNTGQSAQLGELYNFQPLLSIENFRLGQALSHFGGVVFVPTQSSIQRIEECVGKKICAASKSSFGGCVTQLKELFDHNVKNIAQVVEEITFTNSHEAVLYNTNDGLCDCGFVRTDKFEGVQLASPSRVANLRQINPKTGVEYTFFPFKISTAMYPEWVVMAHAEVLEEHQTLVKTILFSIRSTFDAAKSGEYSRWFPSVSLASVIEALYDTGQLTRVEEKESHIWVILISIVTALIVCGVIALLFYALFLIWRRNAYAPKEGTKTFCSIFVTLRNEGSLLEQFPEAATKIVKRAEEIIRKSANKTCCYVVKKVGPAVLVVTSGTQNALEFVEDVSKALSTTKWDLWFGEDIISVHDGDSGINASESSSPRVSPRVGTVPISRSSSVTSKRTGPTRTGGGRSILARTVSFSIGVHRDSGKVIFIPEKNSYDYRGLSVRGSAVVTDVAADGQIVISESVGVGSYDPTCFIEYCTVDINGTPSRVFQFAVDSTVYVFPKKTGGELFNFESIAALIDKQLAGVVQKQVTCLFARWNDLNEMVNRMDPTEFGAQLEEKINRVEAIVNHQRGHIHYFTGNILLITFNTLSSVSNGLQRAFNVATELKADRALGNHISCGISQSVAVVGTFRGHEVLVGNTNEEAFFFESCCRQHTPEVTICTSSKLKSLFDEFTTTCIIDVAQLPFDGETVGVVAVLEDAQKKRSAWSEDYYLTKDENENNEELGPAMVVNQAFEAFIDGDSSTSRALLEMLDCKVNAGRIKLDRVPLIGKTKLEQLITTSKAVSGQQTVAA